VFIPRAAPNLNMALRGAIDPRRTEKAFDEAAPWKSFAFFITIKLVIVFPSEQVIVAKAVSVA
jgi:hypothetical protein